MIFELFRALLLAGVPVGVVSYFLFRWALRRRSPGTVTSLKALARELKRESRERSKEKKDRKRGVTAALAGGAFLSRDAQLDLVHNKWLKFGGGFYGVVGLITYAVVELRELWEFASGFQNLWVLMAHLGLDTLIDLLAGALRNFILVFAWPVFWLSNIHSDYVWIWFVAAYAGYWAGARLALRRAAEQPAPGTKTD